MPTAALHGLVVAQVAGPPGLTAWGPDITTPAVVLATAGVARFLIFHVDTASWHATRIVYEERRLHFLTKTKTPIESVISLSN